MQAAERRAQLAMVRNSQVSLRDKTLQIYLGNVHDVLAKGD